MTRPWLADRPPQVRRSARWRPLLALALVAAGIGVMALAFVPVRERLEGWLEQTRSLDEFWVFPIAGLFVPFCVLWLPGIWVTLFCCLAFGFWPTFPAVVLASNLGAAVAFGLGRTLLAERIRAWSSGRPKLKAVQDAMGTDSLSIVFLLRLTPLVPFNALNYLLGVTPVPFRRYALATFLGMLPGTALNCWTFSQLAELGPALSGELPADPLGLGGLVLRVLFALLATGLIARAARRQLAGSLPGEG